MAEAQLFKDVAPEEYRSAGYLKDLLEKPWEEARPLLFKKLHNAQELVGKKTVGLPAADAPEEEWNKLFDGIKPSSADDYKVPTKEGAQADPLFIKALQQSFLAGRIHPKQSQAFMSSFSKEMETYSAGQKKAAQDKQAKLDADFETLSKSALGENNKPKMAQARKLLEENCPPALKAYVKDIDDKNLVIMAGVINSIAEKYMSEDDLNPNGKTSGDGGVSKRQEAQKLLAEISKMKGFEPDYDAKRAQLKQLYKEAAAEMAAAK